MLNKLDANILDIFNNNSLSYINEDSDTSISGKPISNEIKENSKLKGIIGKIGGIGADANEATRNGRRYPLELWQNVEKSEYFIEGMKNRTIIGEADHPNERLDYSVTEGAVVLTKYEIQNDGKVYTEFDILDTLPGRTVKTYFDAGCKLGVSSRGLGEEIMREGEKIIDPETYQFYCFDVVAFPAVKSARMELIESTSPKRQNLINSIRKEINNCKSLDEVLFIESISKDTDLYLDEIRESLEIKKEEFDISNCDDSKAAYKASKELLDELEKLGPNKTQRDEKMISYLKDRINEYQNKTLKDEGVESLFTQLQEEENKNNKIKISEATTNSDEDTPEGEDDSDEDKLQVLAELQEEVKTKSQLINKLEEQIKNQTSTIKNLISKSYNKDVKLQEKQNMIKSLSSANRLLESNKTKINDLEKQLKETASTLEEKTDKLNALNKKYENLHKANLEFEGLFNSYNSKYNNSLKENSQLKESINMIKSNNGKLKKENASLQESLKTIKSLQQKETELTESINNLKKEYKNTLDANKEQELLIEKMTKENDKLLKQYNQSLDMYIESTCIKYNVNRETLIRLLGENYGYEDVDKVAKELAENISKINSLPFKHMTPQRTIYKENIGLIDSQRDDSNDDMDTFSFMLESKK